MNKKDIIKIFVFLGIFLILLAYTSVVFFPVWEGKSNSVPGISSFYQTTKDSIDVLFIGSSSFRNGISPLFLWEEYGFTSYVRATSAQHPIVSYYYLVEALRSQKPKLVVLDAISLFYDFDVDKEETALRQSIDPLKLSIPKLELIYQVVSNSERQSFISYIFPIFRYHSRWKQISISDFIYPKLRQYNSFKGQYVTKNITAINVNPDLMAESQTEDIEFKESKLYIEKVIELCKEEGIPVVLVSLPRFTTYDYEKHIEIKELSNKYDLTFIDYNYDDLYKLSSIDPKTDFSDPNHLNIYGSKKISENLGLILKEIAKLSDKREIADFHQWNDDVAELHKFLVE
jgi:hypothetical protein